MAFLFSLSQDSDHSTSQFWDLLVSGLLVSIARWILDVWRLCRHHDGGMGAENRGGLLLSHNPLVGELGRAWLAKKQHRIDPPHTHTIHEVSKQ